MPSSPSEIEIFYGPSLLKFMHCIPFPLVNLCTVCEESFPCDFPCFTAFFHVCVLPYEPRLTALRWVKESHRLEWEDRGLGAERKSVKDER
jgi:hypothetical protein